MFDRYNLDLSEDRFKYVDWLVENKEKLLLNALIKYTGLPEIKQAKKSETTS